MSLWIVAGCFKPSPDDCGRRDGGRTGQPLTTKSQSKRAHIATLSTAIYSTSSSKNKISNWTARANAGLLQPQAQLHLLPPDGGRRRLSNRQELPDQHGDDRGLLCLAHEHARCSCCKRAPPQAEEARQRQKIAAIRTESAIAILRWPVGSRPLG